MADLWNNYIVIKVCVLLWIEQNSLKITTSVLLCTNIGSLLLVDKLTNSTIVYNDVISETVGTFYYFYIV